MKRIFMPAPARAALAASAAVVIALSASPAVASATDARVGLGATLPTADSNLSVVGDPLMRQLPEVRTVVRIKSGHSVTLPPDDPAGFPAGMPAFPGLSVAPGLLASPEGLPEAKQGPLKASEQLETVASKDASLDGAKAPAAASKTPSASSKRGMQLSNPASSRTKPLRPDSIH